jgi:GMP synthase-like glutamine amidotransferase
MKKKSVKVAVIDLNNGLENQGMRGIKEILHSYKEDNNLDLYVQVFDLRQNGEIPGLDHDIYISTGGPGSPFDGEGTKWENDLFALLTDIEAFNLNSEEGKKYVFLICHSFQLACRKFKLGEVTERKSNAFGIFPIIKTPEGELDVVFQGLPNPFYSVDSRDWQVVSPNEDRFEELGATVLALEKERPHIELERCLMSIRFTKEIIGTQFHPEADPVGMKMYLLREDKKTSITKNHGEERYNDMLHSLDDPGRIALTQRTMLPNFLRDAIKHI